MSDRDTYKQLLIAESEINRANLLADVSRLREEASRIAHPITGMASILGVLATAFGGWFRRRQHKQSASQESDPPRRSWLRVLTTGAELVSTVWAATRRERRPPS